MAIHGGGIGLPVGGIDLSEKGLKPSSDPTADVAQNTILAQSFLETAGNYFLLGVGEYFVNAPITMSQNATLTIGSGVTISQSMIAGNLFLDSAGKPLAITSVSGYAVINGSTPTVLPVFAKQRAITVKANTVAAISAPVTDVVVPIPATAFRTECLSYGDDVAFFDSANNLLPHEKVVQDAIGFDGGTWIWAFDAFAANGSVFYGYSGNTNAGDATEKGIFVGSVNYATGAVAAFRLINPTTADDHYSPGLYVRADGKIVAVYTEHGVNTTVRTRVSTNAYDVSAWAAEATFASGGAVSYGMIRRIGNTLYSFYRSIQASATWWYRFSTDDGLTWSGTEYPWLKEDGATPTSAMYWDAQVNSTNPNRLDIVTTNGNPGDSAGGGSDNVSLFHCYWIPNGATGNFYNSAGVLIQSGTGPCVTSSMTKIATGNDGVGEFFIPKVFVKPDGNPRALAQRSTDRNLPGVLHKYVMMDFDGSQWAETEIVDAGSNLTIGASQEQWHYLGWFDFDRNDLSGNTFYISRGPSDNTPIWNVEKWRKIGPKWAVVTPVTGAEAPTGSPVAVAIRPTSVRNSATSAYWQVLYNSGYYQDFTGNGFSTGVYGWPAAPSIYYVKIPYVDSAADTTIYVRYKAAGAQDLSNPELVWSDYLYVSHFGIQPGTFMLKDSTKAAYSNGRHAKVDIATQTNGRWARASGPIGNAPIIICPAQVAIASAMQFENASDLNFAGQAALTVDCFARPTVSNTTHNLAGCWVAGGNTTSAFMMRIVDAAGTCTPAAFICREPNTEANSTGGTFAINTWATVGLVFDSVNVKCASNGALSAGTAAASALDAGASPLTYIGNAAYNNSFPLRGDIAEFRISLSAHSADRVKLTDASLRLNSTFVTIASATDI